MSVEFREDLHEYCGSDAARWAEQFRLMALKLGYSDMDEGWLIGWFANAIERSVQVRSPPSTTRPELEAQEAVAWRAVAHPETGMGTMVNQIKHRLTEDADSLYGKGRWTLEELVPRFTPPDAAATIARLEKERDENFSDAKAYADAAKLQRERAESAEAEAARLREAVKAKDEALRFYSASGDYVAPFTGGLGKLYFDCGQMARAALDQPARQVAECVIQQVVRDQQAYYDDWVANWTQRLVASYAIGPRRQGDVDLVTTNAHFIRTT